MPRIRTTLATLLLSAVAAPALAGGFATPAPAPFVPAPPPVVVQPELSWTGAYAGIRLGYGQAESTNRAFPPAVLNNDDDGGYVGVTLGYDYDLGSVIVGGAVEYDATDGQLGATEVTGTARIKGRVGLDSGRNMYYATAGLARVFTDGTPAGDGDGYFFGVGYEVFLTESVTVGAEILHHEFDDFDIGPIDGSATSAGLSLNLRF